MPEYLAPGVVIEEVTAPPSIAGVTTATVGMAGVTRMGPLEPTLVTSFAEFSALFGAAHDDDQFLPDAVRLFFENGGARCVVARIVNGLDPNIAPTLADFMGSAEAATPRGVHALLDTRWQDVAVLHVPHVGAIARDIHPWLVAQCEATMRFAVIDCDHGSLGDAQFAPRHEIADSAFAALYGPWLCLAAETDGRPVRHVPPGGAVCGIFARTDANYGVWRAPANATVRGIASLSMVVSDAEQQRLNPRGINVIRWLGRRGIRVWGARTLSSNPQWRHVSVRRFANFLQVSVQVGIEWARQMPNDATLWARIRANVELFLLQLWRSGAFAGKTPEESFFIRVGTTTMTQHDIEANRLNLDIGVAPIRPAEFVIVRVSQLRDPVTPPPVGREL